MALCIALGIIDFILLLPVFNTKSRVVRQKRKDLILYAVESWCGEINQNRGVLSLRLAVTVWVIEVYKIVSNSCGPIVFLTTSPLNAAIIFLYIISVESLRDRHINEGAGVLGSYVNLSLSNLSFSSR